MSVPQHQVPGPPAVAASHPRPTGRWYYVVTILTAGLFAWVPFLHAAQKLGRPRLRVIAAIYGGVAAFIAVIQAVIPKDAAGDPIGTVGATLETTTAVVIIATIVAACYQLTPLRHEVYRPAASLPRLAYDPAVVAVLAARERRIEARAIVNRDHLMARELRIGRPDMQRAYDDGGLVDLNSAPAATIATTCGIPSPVADLLVQAREARGGAFSEVDEALIIAEVPIQMWDQIRDRAVLVP